MRIISAFILFIFTTMPLSSAQADAGFRVIVHSSNPVTTVNQRLLADIFLKRTVFWPNKQNILVVDLNSESQVRREFSEEVLDRSVSAVRGYWNQLIFSGRGVPPPEFNDDQEVISFVSTHENAIGYVSSFANVRNLRTVRINK